MVTITTRIRLTGLRRFILNPEPLLKKMVLHKLDSSRTLKTAAINLHLQQLGVDHTIIDEKPQDEFKDFVQRVRRIFPPAKLTWDERAVEFLHRSCCALEGYPIYLAPNPQFSISCRIKTEIFTSATMYDLMKKLPGISPTILSMLLDFVHECKEDYDLFSFFHDHTFKPDLDTSSVCIWALLLGNRMEKKEARKTAKILTMNKSLEDSDGKGALEIMIPTYEISDWTGRGGRLGVLDPGVMANVMRLLYHLGMGMDATATEDFLFHWIQNRNYYQLTTKNYEPDAFLFLLSNSLKESQEMKERFGFLIMQRWLESIGKTKNPITLAQRIMTANNLGLINENTEDHGKKFIGLLGENKFDEFKMEVRMLRDFQDEISGGWPPDVFYHCSRFFYGSEAVVTAYATKALLLVQDLK